jgi:hypothetical protein
MFATLAMWEEVFNPWVKQCNTDRSDCRVLWRKSKTAYASEDQTLVNFLKEHHMWEEAASSEVAAPIVAAPAQAVPVTSS